MTTEHRQSDRHGPVIDKVSVPEAARRIGITQSAIHKRIARGQIGWEKDEDGRVFVFLDPSLTSPDESTDGSTDKSLRDPYRDDLLASLQDQVDYLRNELSKAREEHAEEMRRKDHLLAAALERIPALEEAQPEAAREPRESDISASEERGEGEAPPEQEQRRSWLHRFFFGP